MAAVTVSRSTVIAAPIERVWGLMRSFNGHEHWHPAVKQSRIEDAALADAIGCVRNFTLAGGGRIREKLLSLSDASHEFSYCILEAPLPLVGYRAVVRLKPVTESGHTFVQWEGRFEPPQDQARELIRIVAEDIYEAGFKAIRQRLELEEDGSAMAGLRLREMAETVPLRQTKVGALPTPLAGETLYGRAVVVSAYGGPEVLVCRQQAALPPGPGEVRLRHTAVGVNFIDVYCRTGYYKLIDPPAVAGMEAAGVVLDVGEGVAHIGPGDRIAYACAPPGAYSELRTMSAELVMPLPDAIDDELAAAAMLKGISAEFLLHRVARVRAGDTVLVHAAAGGVGLFLCQWARILGATVIGTVGSDEKAGLATRFGCHHVIKYSIEDFAKQVATITGGKGADVIYDGVGQATLGKSFEALAVRGHLVSYGQASGPINAVDIASYSAKSATISRPNYGHYTRSYGELRSAADQLFQLLASGALQVHVGKRFDLAAACDAHRHLEARQTTGSTILLAGR